MPEAEIDGILIENARDASNRRQRALLCFHFPERRTGYDRRSIESSRIERLLHHISIRDGLAFSLVLAVVAANVIDVLYTGVLLQRGATEGNGFLHYLMGCLGTFSALLIKMLVCIAVAVFVWVLRKYRSATILLVAWLIAFGILIAYQTYLFAIR